MVSFSGMVSPLVVDFGVDVLESLELEKVSWILLLPSILGLDKLFGLHLGLGVTDLDIIALRLSIFLVLLQTLISILDIASRILSEVVANDPIDRSLWPVGSSESKLLIRKGDLVATALQGTHSERDSGIVTLSVFVVLGGRGVSVYNCSVVKQLEIPDIVTLLVVLGLVDFPGCAHFRCALLTLLIRTPVSKVEAGQSPSGWLGLPDLVFDNHVVGSASQ